MEVPDMSPSDVGESFVRLALAIDQHFPGYVDAYFGPQGLSHAARQRGKVPLPELAAEAKALAGRVAGDGSLDERRREWLEGEVHAMQTTLRILAGEPMEILDEVRQLYGVTPAWVDEGTFEQAHRALESVLPGDGTVVERGQAFRRQLRVSFERIRPAFDRLAEDLRRRTLDRFPIPHEETCEFVGVRDQSWLAFNRYKGSGRSRIEFNLDWPHHLHQFPEVVAHEAYPGHHTELAIKEQRLVQGEGWLEQAAVLSNSPACLVSEGMAMNALGIIADPDEVMALYGDLLAAAGLPADGAARVRDYVTAGRPLDRVADNQILLLHSERVSDDEVVAYGVRYGLTSEDEQRKLLQFFKDPLTRSYGFNYSIGRELVEMYLGASPDRQAAFCTLLCEPVTPRQLDLVADS
jgi:hypothetical protein